MVSRCANPSCEAQFKYLHEGRLYHFFSDGAFAEPPTTRLSARMFCWWLCPGCCSSMELVQEHADGVTLVPLKSGDKRTTEDNSDRARVTL
jgi:hypothetical protein